MDSTDIPDPSDTTALSRLSPRHVIWIVSAILFIGAVALYPTLRYHLGHVITDDAYVSGNLITISSKVTAQVTRVPVTSGDTVAVGDTLVVLDRQPFRASLEKTRAVVAAARSQLTESEIMLEREKFRAGPIAEQYESEWIAAKARLNAAQAAFEHSERSMRRADRLYSSGLISDSVLDVARIAQQRRKAELEEASELVHKAAAGIKISDGHLHPVRMAHQKVETARANLALAQAEEERAQIHLTETIPTSPVRGIVAKTTISSGELVDEGQTLAFVHDLDTLWVIANVEETQISHIQTGQSVNVTIDAYADLTFEGRVEKVGSVTGSQFAIIPRESLGGNFVKVVQRIPVRISIADPEGLLKLGLSAVVGIDVRG
jgi:membrane fusion protein (multidrug efflux system)